MVFSIQINVCIVIQYKHMNYLSLFSNKVFIFTIDFNVCIFWNTFKQSWSVIRNFVYLSVYALTRVKVIISPYNKRVTKDYYHTFIENELSYIICSIVFYRDI